jgi:3-oxoadipate enol-lactonase
MVMIGRQDDHLAASPGMRRSGRLPVRGAELYYDTEGVGTTAVVLVHGFTLDARMWDDQVAALRDMAVVVRYDARGFGRSSAPAAGVAYSHSADLLALLDHLGVARALLVGLSMGGQIALNTALLAPDRTHGLILLDAVLDGVEWDRESVRSMRAVERALARDGVGAARAVWLAHPLFAPARRNAEVKARLAAMVGDYSGFHWTANDPCEPMVPRPIDVLERVAVPTSVVLGELDVPCFVTMARLLTERIPGARMITVPGAGHMVNMEAPSVVNDIVRGAIAAAS